MNIKLIIVAMFALWSTSSVRADSDAVAAVPREILKNVLASERARRALFSRLTGLAASAVTGGAGGSSAGSVLAEAGSAVTELLTKPQPYQLSNVEKHTIKALASIQHLIGDIFQRVGISLPSIMKLINRRGLDTSALGAPASKSSNLGLLVRGLALSLPLIIPAVNQIRRQSNDSPLQQFAPISMSSEMGAQQYGDAQQYGSAAQQQQQQYQQYYQPQQHQQQSMASNIQYQDQQAEPMMQRRRGKRSIAAPSATPLHLSPLQRELVQSLLQNRRVLEQLRLFAEKFDQ